MEFLQVHISDYDSYFQKQSSVFLTGAYYIHNLPKANAENVRCFVGKFKTTYVGVLGVEVDGVFEVPYMAPHGGFRVDEKLSYTKLHTFVEVLISNLTSSGVREMNITLPPEFYDGTHISNSTILLRNLGFDTVHIELNHYFKLSDFSIDGIYLNNKDLKTSIKALKRELRHEITVDVDTQEEIYRLIQKSRSLRGIPLKMSWMKLHDITRFVQSDFWAVYGLKGNLCAGAVIYKINEEIYQIIYWGFDPEYAYLDSMRYLSFHIFDYYRKSGKAYIDIGISTDQGLPNEGLIAFKENVGCLACTRIELSKKLN